jgi:hypothetical protein
VTEPTPAPAPGWYPDPAGSGTSRWWDGRGWTEHVADAGRDGTVEQPALPPDARVNTAAIWIIALLPLVAAVAFLVWDVEGFLRRALEDPQHAAQARFTDPGSLLTSVVGVLISAAIVVLAWADRRALIRMGVVKPFHWAWSFLPVVYVIGRAVVLRRRVHRGLAPLWTSVVVEVLLLAVIAAKLVAAFAAVAPALSELRAP